MLSVSSEDELSMISVHQTPLKERHSHSSNRQRQEEECFPDAEDEFLMTVDDDMLDIKNNNTSMLMIGITSSTS